MDRWINRQILQNRKCVVSEVLSERFSVFISQNAKRIVTNAGQLSGVTNVQRALSK